MTKPKAGDVFPHDPEVIRITTEEVRRLHPDRHFCIGCPLNLLMDSHDDDSLCIEYPCGSGFVWYGQHVAVVTRIKEGGSNVETK
jgi:hypothetical protein